MKKSPEFYSYKKLIIFGGKNTGKSTLVNYIENGFFDDKNIEKTEESKYNFINNLNSLFINKNTERFRE